MLPVFQFNIESGNQRIVFNHLVVVQQLLKVLRESFVMSQFLQNRTLFLVIFRVHDERRTRVTVHVCLSPAFFLGTKQPT